MIEAVTLKSGHIFEAKPGPDWASSKKLFKAVARELRSVDINLEGLDVSTLKNLDAGIFVKAFLQVAQSDAIEAAVMDCAKTCLLQGEKITDGTFAKQDMRRDYLPVAWEVMKLALLPFFEDLASSFSIPASPNPPGPG